MSHYAPNEYELRLIKLIASLRDSVCTIHTIWFSYQSDAWIRKEAIEFRLKKLINAGLVQIKQCKSGAMGYALTPAAIKWTGDVGFR